MKVSVIIPTYNRADLLERSIQSVFDQQFQDFELIIVDDGSTDDTQAKLARYKNPRLRLIQFPQNRGIGAAREAGVEQALGEWISFLDADDLWLPDKLAYDQAALARHSDVEILFDNYRNVNHLENVAQNGFDQTRQAFERLHRTEIETDMYQINTGLAEAMLVANLIGTASVISVRRTVFERVGNFNCTLSGPEDFEFLWRAALAGVHFAYQTRVLVERHKDEGSITAGTRFFIPRLLRAYDLCETTLRQHQRLDLLPMLNQARRRAWQSLIHTYALQRRRREACQAFVSSLRYGISSQAVLYLLAALSGPGAIRLGRKIQRSLP